MQAPVEAKVFRTRCAVVALALMIQLGLTGCSSYPDALNPISWYRDLTGASKNDDVGDKRNQKNLDAGGQEPYPNLAEVPDAPDSAMSTIDRDALKDSLVADRENAKYSDDQLRAGRAIPGAPPPPPEVATPAKSPSADVTSSSSPPPSATNLSPSPPEAAPAPSAGSAPPPVAPTVASATPAPPQSTSQAAPSTQAAARNTPPAHPAAAPSPKSEAPPDESPLTSPTVAQVPQGETPAAPPPPPQIPPPLPPVTAASPSPALAPPQSASPSRDQATSAVTRLKAPQQQASLPPASALRRGPAISYRVADIAFADGSAKLPDTASGTFAEVAKLYGENGGRIRIVGHGEAASGADAAMNGFTLALDRAQAVAVALTGAGVPAKNITVETVPSRGGGGKDVPLADIYLEN